ncbi:MAG: hypothetical protein RLZZ15_2211 [Verrucomicrobiota bacterium]|jgi:hypothetical protein
MNERESKLTSLTRPKLLLGEGVDEERVFAALVAHAGLAEQIQVLNYRGKDKLGKYLRTLGGLPGFNQLDSLGITRDADEDATATRTSVDALVTKAVFPAALKISVLVLPDDNRAGALEDALCPALESSPVWPCVEELVKCRIAKTSDWPNPTANRGKAKVEAWLSLQDRPTIRLGEAAVAGLLPFDHAAFAPLLAFIRAL